MNTAPALAEEKAGLIDDLIEIWVSPSKVFARRAKSGGFFLMLVVMTVLIGVLYYANRGAMTTIMDAEFARGMAKAAEQGAQMTDEQMQAMKSMGGTFAIVFVVIGIPLSILCIGLGTWLVGKIVGAEFGIGQAMMISSYAYAPKVLSMLAITVQGFLVDTAQWRGMFQPSLGVGRFLDPDMNAGILQLVGRLDVFTLWQSVLLGIGICVVGNISRSKLLPAAALMWVFGAIPSLWTLSRS